ncbi:hypothetical protein F4814DRAFT_458151 [Daldinia grandis]|nr:hypothetical protein F4814DRAFT_458151 [Daldinia grandis]
MLCLVCLEGKSIADFPEGPLTETCAHHHYCSKCLTLCINSQLRDIATDKLICPECKGQLGHATVQSFGDKDLFAQYKRRTVEKVLSTVTNYVWCPLGCGKGQVHNPGEFSPMVFCTRDKGYFCFRHRITWHRDLTCEEYDAFLAYPQSSNRKVQTEEKRRQETLQLQARLRAEEAATASVIQHCPRCTVEIFKYGGCDHMRCDCGYQFYWMPASTKRRR